MGVEAGHPLLHIKGGLAGAGQAWFARHWLARSIGHLEHWLLQALGASSKQELAHLLLQTLLLACKPAAHARRAAAVRRGPAQLDGLLCSFTLL